jgi:hypothetical protein
MADDLHDVEVGDVLLFELAVYVGMAENVSSDRPEHHSAVVILVSRFNTERLTKGP